MWYIYVCVCIYIYVSDIFDISDDNMIYIYIYISEEIMWYINNENLSFNKYGVLSFILLVHTYTLGFYKFLYIYIYIYLYIYIYIYISDEQMNKIRNKKIRASLYWLTMALNLRTFSTDS